MQLGCSLGRRPAGQLDHRLIARNKKLEAKKFLRLALRDLKCRSRVLFPPGSHFIFCLLKLYRLECCIRL
jgi:hypothetical protein